MTEHIFRDYDTTLRHLQEMVLSMAALARHNLERAIRALLDGDPDLAGAVIAADDDVDELERRVDSTGLEVLLRFHPVAGDLRTVIAGMRVGTTLERISDHAVGIAKRARKLGRLGPPAPEARLLEPLYGGAYALLRDALDAFTNRDPALGEALRERDREVDRIYRQLTREFSARLEAHEGPAEAWVHLIFVLRALERIGDLAVNIGEEAVFLQCARDIRHEHRQPAAGAAPPES